ncbi:MAG TPA: HigA family addiction module antitoxin [Acidiphilium sp.]
MPRTDRSHPGEMLRETVFDSLGLTVTEAAEKLDISRVALSRVLNGKAGISVDLARRLELAGVSSARFWLTLQTNYELAQAMKVRPQPKVRKLLDAGAHPA